MILAGVGWSWPSWIIGFVCGAAVSLVVLAVEAVRREAGQDREHWR